MSAPIFISFASKDRGVAETIGAALENRGFACWISTRDIDPGENFQIAIVHAIRSAKVMILVFSANSNNSDEIKKELVLAGQSRLVVVPVRVEDVTPDEAFAYEFATRQWVDVFDDWERSIGRLASQLSRVGGLEPDPSVAADPDRRLKPGTAPEHRDGAVPTAPEQPPKAEHADPVAAPRDRAASPPERAETSRPRSAFRRHPMAIAAGIAAGIALLSVVLILTVVDVFKKPTPPDAPAISSVGPILPQAAQTLVIAGHGFGELPPYVGNSQFIRIGDAAGWYAGSSRNPGGDYVTLAIGSWTDTKIVVDGFRGSYGQYNWTLNPGDTVVTQIWNAQTSAGPATFTATVAAAPASQPVAPAPPSAAPAPPPTVPPPQPAAPRPPYREVQRANQPEARDGAGKITTEAATIHVLACDGPGGNGAQIYVYQYTNRVAFRAIAPPDWSTALGGRDFPSFEEAARAGCGLPPAAAAQ